MTFDGDEWCTPDSVFNPLNKEFQFTLDPCCKKETARAGMFYTPHENGLIQNWSNHSVFCNPPYSRNNINKWLQKCVDEQKAAAVIVALIPSDTSTKWFHEFVLPFAKIRFIKGRVLFVSPDRTIFFRPRFGCLIAIYR